MTTEFTESKFSEWCKNKGYYRKKLSINLSNIMMGGPAMTQNMPSDFIVVNESKTYFIEVKEVLKGTSFPNARFKQQYRLTKLETMFKSNHYKCSILINFVKHKTVAYFNLLEYNALLKSVGKKSISIKDIPDCYIYDWKTLII